ncbi:hypothetical protein ACROYT_G016232 [Oculina patagonica]
MSAIINHEHIGWSACDITLLAKDGKEFKAHRRVLSEASPFFEKLLESDMKENREGVVRLENLTELLMTEILRFIYTGDVQILSEKNAEELIMAGDYLFLPQLKAIAGRFLERSMTTSNCISMYDFAETYRCDELAARAKTFIQSNFVIVAKSEEFLNLTSQEVEEWISSDEIVINAEEDVFSIILGWIAKDQEKRHGKFEELFRHVRLIFASRDFLLKELVTNDLVQQNESCMNRVTQAMNWIDRSTYYDPPSPKSPRKIFGSNVLVAYIDKTVVCYIPDEDHWYQLPDSNYRQKVTSCDGKLYAISYDLKWADGSELLELDRDRDEIYRCYGIASIVWAGDEIFAVWSDMRLVGEPRFLKYNFESHSWKILPLSFLVGKDGVCAVAFNKYIYFVGGYRGSLSRQIPLNDAARFDTVSNTWEEITAIKQARSNAFGAAANEKVYIAGGTGTYDRSLRSCEVYNEMTNEWCFIASLTVPRYRGSIACVDGTLYVLGECPDYLRNDEYSVECYDNKEDKWRVKTTLPSSEAFGEYKACSARVLIGKRKACSGEDKSCSEEDKACTARAFTKKRQVKNCCIA